MMILSQYHIFELDTINIFSGYRILKDTEIRMFFSTTVLPSLPYSVRNCTKFHITSRISMLHNWEKFSELIDFFMYRKGLLSYRHVRCSSGPCFLFCWHFRCCSGSVLLTRPGAAQATILLTSPGAAQAPVLLTRPGAYTGLCSVQ